MTGSDSASYSCLAQNLVGSAALEYTLQVEKEKERKRRVDTQCHKLIIQIDSLPLTRLTHLSSECMESGVILYVEQNLYCQRINLFLVL